MALQEGFFYKTCAMYPAEVNEESPCKSMEAALIESPVHGEPIRVTEDTTMWRIPGVKVGKPHSCYLARFDPATSIGVIFLGTQSPSHSHRFVRVHGGLHRDAAHMLTTVPPAAFNENFYLNLSHPLRVKVLHVQPPSNFNSLRRSRFGFSSVVGPPTVGVSDYCVTTVPRIRVCLDAVSTQTFWELHRAYHVARPTRRTSLGLIARGLGESGSGGAAGGSGGAVGGTWGAAAGMGGGATETWGAATGTGGGATETWGAAAGMGGGATETWGAAAGTGGGATETWGAGGETGGVEEDAPWGRIGKLRIGIDVCCILDDGSEDDSDEEGSGDEGVEFGDILDGTLVVSDFLFGVDNTVIV